jgi:hypothetical protein
VETSSLRQDPRNPRSHDAANLAAVRASLERFGFRIPLVVRRRGMVVIAGNARLRAALDLGWSRVPVVVVDDDAATAGAFAVADNRTAELAGWDAARLGALWEDLRDEDLRVVTGFSDAQVAALVAEAAGVASADGEPAAAQPEPPTPPPPRRSVTRPGDLWALDDHRLLCGDSFDAATRTSALAGRRADAAFCDPPYAIYGSSSGVSAEVADDKMVAPFFRALGEALVASLRDFAQAYVCCDWRSYPTLWDGLRGQLEPRNLIVWWKGGGGLGSNWANTYELLAFFARMPKSPTMRSSVKRGQRPIHAPNLLRHARPSGTDRLHNAAKPVALIAEVLEHATRAGELVVDLFGGSGSVLVACSRMNRRTCATIEKDPRWCDVIVERWQGATGRKARRESSTT